MIILEMKAGPLGIIKYQIPSDSLVGQKPPERVQGTWQKQDLLNPDFLAWPLIDPS